MSLAWEVVEEDIEDVIDCSSELIKEIYGKLDFDKIEKAVLYGLEMEEQIEYAESEIRDQIKKLIENGEIDTNETLNFKS